METQIMMWAKRIYILVIKVNMLFSFFSSHCFLEEIENMYSMFLSSYTNTRESLGELEKAVETLACGSCSHSISRSPKLPLVFVKLDRNTVHVFYFLIATVSNNSYSLHSATISTHTIACLHIFFSETQHCYSQNGVRSQLFPFSVIPRSWTWKCAKL